jgi:hypothetical protein
VGGSSNSTILYLYKTPTNVFAPIIVFIKYNLYTYQHLENESGLKNKSGLGIYLDLENMELENVRLRGSRIYGIRSRLLLDWD